MHRHRNSGLSVLAQGRGLMGGGVELECFGEDRRAYTLNGESFLKPSKSPEGQYAKPYRKCQLALPKTYITRRGHMVLFTSPEDMIIGQSVVLHRREVTSETAATKLKTVNKLVSSTLTYEPDKIQMSELGEFTPVYLQRLREAAERAKEAENYQAQGLEKGEEEMDGDDLEAADSGIGVSLRPSSGRLSSLSHYSDGTIIQIPDGRLAEENEDDVAMVTDYPLKQLAGELSGYTKTKPKSTVGKHTKKKKSSSEQSTQKTKSKGKKKKRSRKKDGDGGCVVSQGGSKVNDNDHTNEIERKKAEKRALEKQREFEARERARLEEQLRRLQEEKTKTGSGERSDSVCEGGEDGEEGGRGRVERECGGVRRGQGIAARREDGIGREDTARRKREELQRKKQLEAEKAKKARLAYEKGAKLREESNCNNHLELNSLRHYQSITQPYTFSYFCYVPPRTGKGAKAGGKTGGKGVRGGQKTKRRKPPEK